MGVLKIYKNYFLVGLIVVCVFAGVASSFASAPAISTVKYKASNDAAKIAVIFDQAVQKQNGQQAGTTDFTLAGSTGAAASVVSVEPSENNQVFVLAISQNVSVTGAGQWTIAASSTLYNSGAEQATTTATDLYGNGDDTRPSVSGAFQHGSMALDVLFSEEVDGQTATSSGSYASLLTSAVGDTPGISSIQLSGERKFAIIMVTSSTTLGWGTGNSIDIGTIRDLVGNQVAATTTNTIFPAFKISEVKAESTVNTSDEFIEIYNFGDLATSISSTTFFLHVRNGSTDLAVPLTFLRSSVPDRGYYLIGNQAGYSGTVALDATYATSSDVITANSSIYISGSATVSQSVFDLLGMGSSSIKETATTTALVAGKSYERKSSSGSTASTMAIGGSDEFKGNSSDYNNNNSDFALRTAPQPQNSSSPREFPFGGPGQNDTTPPQVQGSFPSGTTGEVVPTTISFVGFHFSKQVQESSVSTSTVKLFAGSDTNTNLCSSVQYTNFASPGNPPGRCNISSSLSSGITYTFKILGTSSPSYVQDFSSNRLNQSSGSHGINGDYVITFTPSGGDGGFNFQAQPVFVMGTSPFPGAANIPTSIKKINIKFSGDVSTNASYLNTTNVRLIRVSTGAAVSMSSVAATASESQYSSDLVTMTLANGVSLAANSEYQIAVNNLIDTSSRQIASYSAMFTTGAAADASGPLVTGKLPNITTGVPVNAIDIHVMTDDKLDPSTISSSTVRLLQGSNSISGNVMFDPFTGEIIFLASNVFLANTSYTVSVSASTVPCVKNISDLCLQDNDGMADNAYTFSFTTASADAQGPRVIFASADQRHLSVTFDEPVNYTEAEDLSNYSLIVNSATSTLSTLSSHRAFYDDVMRTINIDNLSLPMNGSFTVTASNIHDLSGNLIGSTNSAQGTVQNMSMTNGFIGPGGPPPSMGAMPQNFSTSTFGFVPQADVRPFAQMAGVSTTYGVGIPISQQVKNSAGSGKIVLTFPTGFDITSAIKDPYSPMRNDVNGPGAGTIGFSVATDTVARTITITLTENTRCDSANVAPCTGDAHDFLSFDIANIVNSSIPKDGASSGYTVDIKTFSGSTILESMTSRAFYLTAGGTNVLQVVLSAAGASSGTATIRMFSPFSGPRDTTSSAFSGGYATGTFSNLNDGMYGVFTDSDITLGGTDYLGRKMPTPINLSGGATTTMQMALTSTAALTTVTVNVTGPTGKNIDVFANSGDRMVVKATTTTGSQQSMQLKLADGSWFVGVGPNIPMGPFSGSPPAPDFVMQPPIQVSVNSGIVKESSGTADDGIISFTLGTADKVLPGYVKDEQNRPVVGAEVFAYSPMGGFGTHGTTDALGHFQLNLGVGLYQVGAFVPGLPPIAEVAVEVTTTGIRINGQSGVTDFTLKVVKPERTISGKVLDQNNNAVQNAGVFAYCDPSTANNSCFGPGDHTGSPTGTDGSYTLYVRNGTWKVGAFMPGYGDLPQVTKVVSGSDFTNVNFSPATNVTFVTISGTVCRGSSSTCQTGDTKQSGTFVRAFGSQGSNQAVTDLNGAYTIRVPSGTGYTVEAHDPSIGRLQPLSNVDLTSSTTSKDFVIGALRTITVNVKDSSGNVATSTQLFVDFKDFTTTMGSHLVITNATTSSISLPNGSYRVRASIAGRGLADSAIGSDDLSNTFFVSTSTAILTVNGNERIKITIPSLGIVSGTVYKDSIASGNALRDAFVGFSESSTGTFINTQTDSNGSYTLRLPVGTYNAIAQKPGYLANPTQVQVTSTSATTTANLIVSSAALTISGTVTINGTAASKAFVRAERLGGGFAGAQVDATGVYTLSVANGQWYLYAVAEGYAGTAFSGNPVEVSNSSFTGRNIDLSTAVYLASPKVCQITPAEGGECYDASTGIRVIVPPGALGTDTNAATLTIKQTNSLPQTSGSKPSSKGFDFKAVDSSGNVISTFNSLVTIIYATTTSALAADGFDTRAKVDGLKFLLWSETLGDYDALQTMVEYLDGSDALVGSPASDLSNVTKIKFTALTSHFSGGGPGGGEDSIAPAAPASVSVSSVSLSSGPAVRLSWTAVSTNSDGSVIDDLSDYRIWRSQTSGSGFSVITTTSSGVVTYDNTSATAGQTYYYRVTARDTSGNESSPGSSSAITLSVAGGGSAISMIPQVSTPSATPTAPAAAEAKSATVVELQAKVSDLISQLKVLIQRMEALGIKVPEAAKKLVVASAKVVKLARQLEFGMQGDDVKALQGFLAKDKSIYPAGLITSYYGKLTRDAVKKFQSKYGISQVGRIGPVTMQKINELLEAGQ